MVKKGGGVWVDDSVKPAVLRILPGWNEGKAITLVCPSLQSSPTPEEGMTILYVWYGTVPYTRKIQPALIGPPDQRKNDPRRSNLRGWPITAPARLSFFFSSFIAVGRKVSCCQGCDQTELPSGEPRIGRTPAERFLRIIATRPS